MQAILQDAREFLETLNRYSTLIQATDPGFEFELLFAYYLEKEAVHLEYEVQVNPLSKKTVDFLCHAPRGNNICFELHKPELDDEIERSWQGIPDPDSGEVYVYGIDLSSRDPNEHLRPEAQTIRLQEKLLAKVEKFPLPSSNVLSVLVVNCQHIHFGMLDSEDVRMVMYGRTQNPAYQEHWENKRILGLCETENLHKDAQSFRDKVSAVIFIPDPSKQFFDGAFIALNTTRSAKHLELCRREISGIGPLCNLNWIT